MGLIKDTMEMKHKNFSAIFCMLIAILFLSACRPLPDATEIQQTQDQTTKQTEQAATEGQPAETPEVSPKDMEAEPLPAYLIPPVHPNQFRLKKKKKVIAALLNEIPNQLYRLQKENSDNKLFADAEHVKFLIPYTVEVGYLFSDDERHYYNNKIHKKLGLIKEYPKQGKLLISIISQSAERFTVIYPSFQYEHWKKKMSPFM